MIALLLTLTLANANPDCFVADEDPDVSKTFVCIDDNGSDDQVVHVYMHNLTTSGITVDTVTINADWDSGNESKSKSIDNTIPAEGTTAATLQRPPANRPEAEEDDTITVQGENASFGEEWIIILEFAGFGWTETGGAG